MARGYFSLLLHAHLPFVRHPEHPSFFEERWLFEAITECYLPLLRCFDRLVRSNVRFRLTLSLSPTLAAMLRDDLLRERWHEHMGRLLELADREVTRTSDRPDVHRLARSYRDWFADSIRWFDERCGGDLVSVLQHYEEAGYIELVTTAATHGFLPLLRQVPAAVEAQIQTGVDEHRRRAMAGKGSSHPSRGSGPAGFWLPECAYYPGLEESLGARGIRWFVVDAHGVLNGSIRPHYGVHAPIACANGVAAFPRDPDIARQVWSARHGYPGDFDYREFYRDVGYDLELEQLQPFVRDGDKRAFTGIKYHAVSGSEQKRIYDPERAQRKAAIHAGDFLDKIRRRIDSVAGKMERPPMVLAPFDAELFGHWWFEGPYFLEYFFRKIETEQDDVVLVTPTEYLTYHPVLQRSTPSASTWGQQGYSEHWLNARTSWIWPELHHLSRELQAISQQHEHEPLGSPKDRALRQAARTLLLAQASDWPFILKNGTSIEYAQRRVKDLVARTRWLLSAVTSGTIEIETLTALEALDTVFPELDHRVFRACSRDLSVTSASPAPSADVRPSTGTPSTSASPADVRPSTGTPSTAVSPADVRPSPGTPSTSVSLPVNGHEPKRER